MCGKVHLKALIVVMVSLSTFIIVPATSSTAAGGGGSCQTCHTAVHPSNPHYFPTMDTALCGSCHGSHATEGKNLLGTLAAGMENDIYRNCIYCHKSGGQSKLDVFNGAILGSSGNTYAASGGGIVNMVAVEGATPQMSPVTSKHNVDMGEGDTIWVPGFDTGPDGNQFLTCTGCHVAHGGKLCTDCHGSQHSNPSMKRLLRRQVAGIAVTPPEIQYQSLGENRSTRVYGDINNFCAACHRDFNAQIAGAGDQESGAYTRHKRHRVGMDPAGYPGINQAAWTSGYLSQPSSVLPLQNNNGANQVGCLTCHFAHGTYRTNSVTFNRANGTTANSSTLLRLANRGVCQSCHNK